MARRSEHTKEELLQLIIDETRNLIASEGVSEFSIRNLSNAIGYTPGTIYQHFSSKHDLILEINMRTFDLLAEAMNAAKDLGAADKNLHNYAQIYSDFVYKNQNLWLAIFEYSTAGEAEIPREYYSKIEQLICLIEHEIDALTNRDVLYVENEARLLWASVHSLCTLRVSGKLNMIFRQPFDQMIERMVDVHLTAILSEN